MKIKSKKSYIFSIVGATGVVGREALSILAQREFPLKELRLFASERSLNQQMEFLDQSISLQTIQPASFQGSDFVFFTAGAKVSREFAPLAAHSGAVVIDNSSAFRMEPDVPLAVPEINGNVLAQIPSRRIISVGNCCAIPIAVAVAPLHQKAQIQRLVISTYQSTSGAGRRAMEELSLQVRDLFNCREVQQHIFPHPIAFNLIPEIGEMDVDGHSGEEKKIKEEIQKILGAPHIKISATSVRVPIFHCHAMTINVQTEKLLRASEARSILENSPGITVVDHPSNSQYPTPIDSEGQDTVFVGRIRQDDSVPNALDLWVVSDNLRKGAALNAIQIAERLIENGLV